MAEDNFIEQLVLARAAVLVLGRRLPSGGSSGCWARASEPAAWRIFLLFSGLLQNSGVYA